MTGLNTSLQFTLFHQLQWKFLIQTQNFNDEVFNDEFFNDEIQLSVDWRVALSEIIIPTKIENFVDENLTVYILQDHEDSPKTSSVANVISGSHSGNKLPFMLGPFDTVAQVLATVKRTV